MRSLITAAFFVHREADYCFTEWRFRKLGSGNNYWAEQLGSALKDENPLTIVSPCHVVGYSKSNYSWHLDYAFSSYGQTLMSTKSNGES